MIRPYQSMALNIIETLILVDVNFLLSLMQSNTNQTKIWLIHILVLVPIPRLSICVWFMGVSLVKSDICRNLPRVMFKRRQQTFSTSREQQCEERQPSQPNVSVREVHLYENNEEREPLIGIVDDNW